MASETRDATMEERIAALEEAKACDGDRHWWRYRRELPTGLILFVFDVYCGFRIGLGKSDKAEDGFCTVFDWNDTRACWRTALGWNGEGDPEGWVRRVDFYPQRCRRRPDGTPASEYEGP